MKLEKELISIKKHISNIHEKKLVTYVNKIIESDEVCLIFISERQYIEKLSQW